MAAPKYYLRSTGENCSIQVIYQLSRTLRMRTATGLKIDSAKWHFKEKKVPNKEGIIVKKISDEGKPRNLSENKKLKATLTNLSLHIENQYNLDYTKGVRFSNQWLKDTINEYFNRPTQTQEEDDNLFSVYLKDYSDQRQIDSRTKKSTDQKFVQLQTKFKEYEKKKKSKYLISEIDKKFLLDFRRFLIDDFKMMESSANRTLKNVKTVLLDARDNGKIINHQINSFSIENIPAVKVFLSFVEIEKIKDTHIIGADLQHAKDWLIIGCYTGQRVSDLLRMTKEMIFTKTDSEGQQYRFIELTQEKTGAEVTIPIHNEVEEILQKYDGNFPPTFGKKGDSKFVLFNRYIKKVCELAGIDSKVKGKVFNDDTKRNEITETEKFNLVSSHICRRSFCTNFYGDKRFTTPQLMAISSHATETVFLSYIGKNSSDHAMQTAKTFKEIEDKKILLTN